MNTKNITKCIAMSASLSINAFLGAQSDLNVLADASSKEEEAGGWEFDILVGGEYEPTYAGSDDHEFEPQADFRATYEAANGNQYTLALGEIAAVHRLSERWFLQAKFEYEEGRDADDDDILKELTPVRSTVEGELLLAYRLRNKFLFVNFQPDVLDRGKGIVYFFGGGMDFATKDRKWMLDTRFDVSWGNSEYMMTEFGISEADSVASGLAAYTPESGMKSVTVDLLGQRRLNEHWSLLGSVSVERYTSKAADSPLIKDHGSRTTHELALGLMYRF